MPEFIFTRLALFSLFAIGVCMIFIPNVFYKVNIRSLKLQSRFLKGTLLEGFTSQSLGDIQKNKSLYVIVYRALGILFMILIVLNLKIHSFQ